MTDYAITSGGPVRIKISMGVDEHTNEAAVLFTIISEDQGTPPEGVSTVFQPHEAEAIAKTLRQAAAMVERHNLDALVQ